MTDLIIRDQRPSDRAAVADLLTAAFGRAVVAELSEALAATDDPGARLVAERAGELIGQVQLSGNWVDTPWRLLDVLVLSPLGVRPGHQNRGVGSQLVRAAITRATDLGSPLLFLEGSPQYYARFGFSAAVAHGFQRPSLRIPEAGFQVVLLPGRQEWMTGALVYRDAFWRYDCVGQRQPS